MKDKFLLEANGINKTFGGTKALDDVHIHVRPASVHGLMGENGAGKSTLMKIIMGIITADSGDIVFDDKKCNFTSPIEALESGIVMIHQELAYVPYRSIAENIFLYREPTTGFRLVDHKKMYNDSIELLKNLKFDGVIGDPKKQMASLTVAQQQMVEIAKAVSYNAKLVIMDEPTSAITQSEIERLFDVIRDLKSRGISIIYTTHKMEETYKIVDEITVLRDGKWIETDDIKQIDSQRLVKLMVGRDISQFFGSHTENKKIGDEVLKVENLGASHAFSDVSFSVRQGEILGFAGLVGSGRTEIAETIFGIRKKTSGKIYFKGKEIDIKKPSDAIAKRMAFLTEDRKVTGIYPMLSVEDNITVVYIKKFLSKLGLIKYKNMDQTCVDLGKSLSIKMSGIGAPISSLSGGNQQKVLLARWMVDNVDLFILDEPTRGIDVGAKSEIYRLINELSQKGHTIIFISSEMPEILANCDRVLVMNGGRLMGILDRKEATQEKIMTLAAGM